MILSNFSLVFVCRKCVVVTFSQAMATWTPKQILTLGARYLVAYVLFALAVKAMPVAATPVQSIQVLPGFAVGLAFGLSPLIHLFRSRQELLAAPPAPRAALWSGLGAALVAVTTVLIYRVEGITILLALLLMRGGVLALAPLLDRLQGHAIQPREAVAVALSLCAVLMGLLTVEQAGNVKALFLLLILYLFGNGWRLRLMLAHAKRPVAGLRAAWLVAEFRVAILGVAFAAALAISITGIPRVEILGFGLFIGLVYAAVLAWGSTVYLDPSNTSLSVVMNRGASMFAGVIASLLAIPLLEQPIPGVATWAAAGLVILAIAACTFGPGRSGPARP